MTSKKKSKIISLSANILPTISHQGCKLIKWIALSSNSRKNNVCREGRNINSKHQGKKLKKLFQKLHEYLSKYS